MVICIGIFIISFLLGSIPWGLVISKVFFHMDLRTVGSGNIGTTNAIRAMGKAGGYLVFVLDFAKGVVSGLIAYAAQGLVGEGSPLCDIVLACAFLGCIWGHVFCPWLGFKGGKGIATAVGCMFVSFGPLIAILELLLFTVIVITTRYVSAGSIASAVTCPLFSIWRFWGNIPAIIITSAAALTIVWAHRGNIKRLREGTESRVGKKKPEKR